MNFNLDLVCAELADLRPVKRFQSSPLLDLDRIEMLRPTSEPRAGSLFIAEADELAKSGSAVARSGPFVVLGCESEEALGPAAGSPAILLPPSDRLPQAPELLTRLLEYRMRLDAWSEDVLAAMARDAPLQEIFEAAATMFANPIMLSDGSLYFVLTAGRLPDGFRDRLWTPAIETGMCPSELYFESWTKSSGDAFGRPEAYLVPNAAGDGRTYLVRNLMCDGAYHGCFELVDANAPLTPADLALADRFGDMLGMVLPRKAYPQIAEASLGPLRDLLAGSSVRPRVLEYGLAKMGWKTDDAYYVAHFGGVDEEADARRAQTARRIAEHYPLARFYDDGAEHVMIAREEDYPLAFCTTVTRGTTSTRAPSSASALDSRRCSPISRSCGPQPTKPPSPTGASTKARARARSARLGRASTTIAGSRTPWSASPSKTECTGCWTGESSTLRSATRATEPTMSQRRWPTLSTDAAPDARRRRCTSTATRSPTA